MVVVSQSGQVSDGVYMRNMSEEWYYCVEHNTVEPKLGCRILDRLGPYPTREAAENALETVEKRNQEWDGDPDWNDEAE